MHSILQKINLINQKILLLLESSQWDEILLLSHERDGYVKRYFKITPLPDDQSIVSKIAEEISTLDEKIVQLISEEKETLINQGLSLKKSHNAIRQYSLAQTG